MKILKNEFRVKLESDYGMGNCREYGFKDLNQAVKKYNDIVNDINDNKINCNSCVLKLIKNNEILNCSRYDLKGE